VADYQCVFKRVEKKHRLGATERRAVEAAAREGGPMAVDAYGRTRITSLYVDTPDRAMIARSVEKPLYKEKLRLRAYGEAAGVALMTAFGAGPARREPDGVEMVRHEIGGGEPVRREAGGAPLSDGEVEARAASALAAAGLSAAPTVFFGIKKKFKGIVYKRRLALTLPAALAFVSGLPYEQAWARWPVADGSEEGGLAPGVRQIARELTAAMDRWLPLAPSMGIACDREAWAYAAADAFEGCDGAGGRGGIKAAGSFDLAPRFASDAARRPVFDPGLRLTFDDGLVYLDCRQPKAPWVPIIASDEAILEIKSAGPYPPWLVTMLSTHRIYPASFTKYGSAYQLAHCGHNGKKWTKVGRVSSRASLG
jgi:hypothetical protein